MKTFRLINVSLTSSVSKAFDMSFKIFYKCFIIQLFSSKNY